MTQFRPRLWTGVSAAVLASSLVLAGCGSGEGGEAGEGASATASGAAAAGEAGEGGAAQSAAQAAGEGGEGGSEGGGGEAGTSAAYTAVPQASRDALRLAQLRGFFLAARAAEGPNAQDEAAALLGQGLLEVYDPSQVEYTRLGLQEPVLRRAAQTGARADVDAAIAQIDAARQRAGGAPAAVTRGMISIASGLYRQVIEDGVIDPTEYQHSHGAALSALQEIRAGAQANPQLASARGDVERFAALWPTATPPEDAARVTPVQQVQAQASRIELALSSAG